MKKKSNFLLLIMIGLILNSACNSNNKYYIKTETASNVVQDMEIIYRGTKVGTVSDIIVKNAYVILEVEINEDITISKDASFKMVSKDLFTKAIELKPMGNHFHKSNFYADGDTIKANLKFRDDEAIRLLRKITNDIEDQDTLHK
jgi:ABC-type transporter Mla subunit MlaD